MLAISNQICILKLSFDLPNMSYSSLLQGNDFFLIILVVNNVGNMETLPKYISHDTYESFPSA